MASAMEIPRRERERLQHRQEILSVAQRLFAEKGFHNVSVQEIATAAEFATGTLYNFFPSKEELFFQVLVACADEGLDLILPALEGPDDERHKLSRYIHAHERLVREQAAALQLYLLESRGHYLSRPQVEAKKKEVDERVISALSRVIADGIAKGLFNEIDPVIAARCLSATLESMILADPPATSLKTDLQKVEAVFFKGFIKSSGENRDA